MTSLIDRYHSVQNRIAEICIACDRNPDDITLIAVSKGQPAEAITTLVEAGHQDFGENYLQEFEGKATQVARAVHWRFIGALQSNKIARIVALADEIQSVSQEKHAQAISRHAKALGKTPYPIYISVNLDDEPQKSGIPLAEAMTLAKLICDRWPLELDLQGLMSIPPRHFSDAQCDSPPPSYLALRDAATKTGRGKLSLGMSRDLSIAIRAGSDLVRVGTDLFGPRPKPLPKPPEIR